MPFPLHPALVHIPLGLAIALPLVAAGLTLAIRWQRLPRSSFAVVTGLLLLIVGGGFTAMEAGEGDADRVAAVVGDEPVEAHEEAAETFVWSAVGVLVLSVAVLILPSRWDRWASAMALLVTVATLALAGLGILTGKRGGELVYTLGATRAYQQQQRPVGQAVAPVPASRGHDD